MVNKDSLIAKGRQNFAFWVSCIHRSAILVVAGIIALTVFAGWHTVKNLAINTSTSDMISAETPFRRNAIDFDNAFPQLKHLIVIVIDATSSELADIAASKLVSALRKKTHLFERVTEPGRDEFFSRNGLLFFDTDSLSSLADRLAAAEPLLAALAQQPDLQGLFDVLTLALREDAENADIGALLDRIGEIAVAQAAKKPAELSWRNLIELGGGHQRIVLTKAASSSKSLSPNAAALSEIRDTAKQVGIGAENGTNLRLTGSIALNHEELQSAAVGGKMAGLASLVLVATLLIFGLRSVSLIVPALISLIVGLIWTAAFATIAIGHLNLISVAFAVLFVGLGIDFSIHFCLRYREALANTQSAGEALEQSAEQIGGSLATSAICAALGFLAFLPTDYQGLAELGLISAGGMMIALFINLTLLPALLRLFPKPNPARHGNTPLTLTLGHSRIIVIGAAALGIAGIAVAYHARFDFNPMNLKDQESESVSAFYDLASDSRNGVYAIDILSPNRKAARAEAARLRALPAVGDALTIDSFIPENQNEKLAVLEDIAYFLVPALDPAAAPDPGSKATQLETIKAFRDDLKTHAAARQESALGRTAARTSEALTALLTVSKNADPGPELEKRLTVYLPHMLNDLRMALSAEAVTFDKLPASLKNSWIAIDGRFRVQLRPVTPIKSNDELRQFASVVLANAPNAVGAPVTITEAGDAVVEAFREATLIAFLLVSIILLIVLRRPRDIVLVLFPLILAAVFTGATSVVLGLPFNFANVIVLPLLFGLGVASGIHLVQRARRASHAEDLMKTSTPRAVLFSALTTIASFGSLALSSHQGMTSMGQLLTIAIAYTLLCTLIVLPAMMVWVEHRAQR